MARLDETNLPIVFSVFGNQRSAQSTPIDLAAVNDAGKGPADRAHGLAGVKLMHRLVGRKHRHAQGRKGREHR